MCANNPMDGVRLVRYGWTYRQQSGRLIRTPSYSISS